MQALIALPALRRAGDDDAIADLDALDVGADRFDDAEAAMIRNFRAASGIRAERAAHDRVARRDGQRSDDDLTGFDRQKTQLLHVECRGMADEAAERAARLRPRDDAGRLRLQRRAAAERGGTCLEQMSA